jgi:nitrate reductase delta subunit
MDRQPSGRRNFLLEAMLKTATRNSDHLAAIRQIKAWTRERFALSEDVAVMVAELACGMPGCPPLETVVTFWTTSETRHVFKAFKPAAAVALDDLPPSWMKNAIISDSDDPSCC